MRLQKIEHNNRVISDFLATVHNNKGVTVNTVVKASVLEREYIVMSIYVMGIDDNRRIIDDDVVLIHRNLYRNPYRN